MKIVLVATVVLVLIGSVTATHADVFNLGLGFTNLETVIVGDPGNIGELSGAGAGGYGPDRVCGAVSYVYNIGKYEVTAKQYTDFLNKVAKTDAHGLYNTKMWDGPYACKIERTGAPGNYSYSVADDWANRPVNYVSYWDACRFANWLHNGQPAGAQDATTTERGAYVLDGYNSYDGRNIQRDANWKWALANEDEWYKAAYYKGGGTNAGYWDYPTQNDSTPSNQLVDPDPGNNANYDNWYLFRDHFTIGDPYYRTNVGEFENSESAYGTFDQGGNAWEWIEDVVEEGAYTAYRGLRGGSFYLVGTSLRASMRESNHLYPTEAYDRIFGFRLVQSVPEPSSIIALAGGLVTLLGIRRRKA